MGIGKRFFIHGLLLVSIQGYAEGVFNQATGVMHLPVLRIGQDVYADVDFQLDSHGRLDLLRYRTVETAADSEAEVRKIAPLNAGVPLWYKPRTLQGVRDSVVRSHAIHSLGDWNYFAKNYPEDFDGFRNFRPSVDFGANMLVVVAAADPAKCSHKIEIREAVEYDGHVQINYVYYQVTNLAICLDAPEYKNHWALFPATSKPVKFVESSPN